MGINLVHSSSYNPRSMGLAERSVRSVKGLLKKNSRLSQLELDELMFTVNTNQQGINQGSSLERFLGRSINTAVPNSLAKSFGFEEAIKERAAVREKRWLKPERGTKLTFAVGELVKIQNPRSLQWDATGIVQAVRLACDGRVLSYDIQLTNGGMTVRHRKYLMKVNERLPTGADRGTADQGVMRLGADLGVMGLGAEGDMETSIVETVTRPLSDQVGARASGESGQLSQLRPRRRI